MEYKQRSFISEFLFGTNSSAGSNYAANVPGIIPIAIVSTMLFTPIALLYVDNYKRIETKEVRIENSLENKEVTESYSNLENISF